MLRKLLKHEFRATGRVILPIFGLLLLSAVGANLSIRGMTNAQSTFLNTLGTILIMLFFLAIIAVGIVALAVMVSRFYKNLLQDEGYVMMTLPVSIHQQVWSKLIVSTVCLPPRFSLSFWPALSRPLTSALWASCGRK